MTTTYGDLRGYRGYFAIASACAGVCAQACPRHEAHSERRGNNPDNPANPATPFSAETKPMTSMSQHRELLHCLRSRLDVRMIRDSLSGPQHVGAARAWIVEIARSTAFRDELTRGLPQALVPVVALLWDAWRERIGRDMRVALKQLRRVVRAVSDMESTVRECLEDENRA